MSSTRPRRAAASQSTSVAASAPDHTPIRRQRSTRNIKPEPKEEFEQEEEDDAEGETDGDGEEEEEEEVPAKAGPSRSSRKSGGAVPPPRRASARGGSGRTRGRPAKAETPDNDEEQEVAVTPGKRTRLKKSVSYKEIPIDVDEEEGDEEEETPPTTTRRRSTRAPSTPQRKSTTRAKSPEAVLEKVGSGRGGFSVKGAASAAAKARWAKVRRERAERGEDDDDDRDRRRRKTGASRPSRSAPAVETYEPGTTLEIKGVEYTVGDDELELPNNPKGETKVDALGNLLGGREWKIPTFTSATRRNPERLYGLTIDVARACGYSDSLGLLRRCPQLLKLSCNNEEREMLIGIGRVSGNLKNRMVTIVTMRNVFKIMGARLVKNGKWVTDDYDEDEALVKCQDNEFTPYGPAHEDEITAEARSTLQPVGRPSHAALAGLDVGGGGRATALHPIYTVGGLTTHFGGSGIDPWSDAGWGGKRTKLRSIGVGHDDWMLRTAEEGRAVDKQLREYREERLKVLDELDAARGWVYAVEEEVDAPNANGNVFEKVDSIGLRAESQEPKAEGLRVPLPNRKRSALSHEITLEEDALTPLTGSVNGAGNTDDDTEEERDDDGLNGAAQKDQQGENGHDGEVERTPGGKIVVESPQAERINRSKYNYGLGQWKPGVVRATYEPHTHMPHLPLHTQPHSGSIARLSPYPIISSQSDTAHRNFVQSRISGKVATGLASVEYVFEGGYAPELDDPRAKAMAVPGLGDKGDESGSGVWTLEKRLDAEEMKRKRKREIEEALEWEARSRKKQKEERAAQDATPAAS